MTLSIHYLRALDEPLAQELSDQLPLDTELTTGLEVPSPARYQVLIAGRPKREHLEASPELHTLVIPWAGLPDETRQLMLEYPHIAVHNLHHNAHIVAEHTIALLLAAAKSLVPIDSSLRRHDWRPRYQPINSIVLEGKTALVLGYGAIGRRVAHLCRGLGMEVVAVRRGESAAAAQDSPQTVVKPLAALKHLLPRAHALLICLPHTPQTTGLIGAEELALLPPDALLVNIGRGPIVDEGALYHTLRDGALHAAGLDVWYNYPAGEAARACTAPSSYPFHELDNVVMSPHRAGHSGETEGQRIQHLVALLNAAARGEELPNRVDLKAGY